MFLRFLIGLILLAAPVSSFAEELLYPDAISRYNNGVKEQQAGRFEKAEAEYRVSMILTGPQARILKKYILNNSGLMAIQSGELERAEECFRMALEIDPGYRAATSNLGLLHLRRGDAAGAFKIWSAIYDFPKQYMLEGPKESEGPDAARIK